jgi:hypothetical protein
VPKVPLGVIRAVVRRRKSWAASSCRRSHVDFYGKEVASKGPNELGMLYRIFPGRQPNIIERGSGKDPGWARVETMEAKPVCFSAS